MENIFETIAAIVNPETAKMRLDLINIENKIKPLEAAQNGGYTAQVAKSFHLGMVGGSGRNTYRLNKRREYELDKTIDRAAILVKLYKERDNLKVAIEYIESGKRDADRIKNAANEVKVKNGLVEYWKTLKAGDKIDLGGNSPAIITKKNAKSIETGTGCKWTATEIIGKKAASLL